MSVMQERENLILIKANNSFISDQKGRNALNIPFL